MPKDLKDTLQLPRTEFAMRANLVQREPARLAHWERLGLYARIQQRRASAPSFVLHDGPPFTNGDVHIGTALNKILKDATLRYKSLRGFRTPYVPGWDCHGLPIEQKVMRALQAEGKQVSTAEMRSQCDAFSESWIATQKKQFQRLGVLADWAAEYKTKDPRFEADIIRTFASFVERSLVYRAKKPVYWSIPFETALAEAEIEYKDHTAIAIWVKFVVPTEQAEKFSLPTDKPLSIVIWTTTPWTIPANLAIAVHPEVDYVVADLGAERIIVAQALLASVVAAANQSAAASTKPGTPAPAPLVVAQSSLVIKGAALEHLAPRHPFIDRAAPVVLADYVTTESGTGCVHTAPGHGAEDYLTGLKYGLEIYCPVGDDGRYLDDSRVPADLVGLTTLETVEDLAKKRPAPANLGVLKKLAAAGALLAKEKYAHSYPHCWRSKTPIIFRAVDQWFVGLDRTPEAAGPASDSTLHSQLSTPSALSAAPAATSPRATALAAISGVRWIPAWGENRIRGAVEARPDWCISRQRSWGVPIIAFYDAQKNAWLDAGVVRAVAAKIAERGTNFWYDAPATELLAGVTLPAGWPAASELTPGRDTLDVWLDSGSSHLAVLANQQGTTSWPADLYLEGSDQHRGWFQSSLWTGVIARGGAPYRAVLTHGFVVGEDGKKISKSGTYEKPPTSDNFVATYGADVIRLWVASQDFTQDITLSEKILGGAAEAYRLFRNTFRYQLSVLWDFDVAQHAVPLAEMDPLDRWVLHQLAVLVRDVTAAYDAYEFHRAQALCNQFCATTLSAVYHDILKDRLYTHGSHSLPRRSSQTAIHHLCSTLTRLLAPILTFTCDETWSFFRTGAEYADDVSVHLEDWPAPPAAWTEATLAAEFDLLLRARARVNEALEPLRQAGRIGKSLDAALTLASAPGSALHAALERHRDSLPELFIVSHVSLTDDPAATELVATGRPAEELGFVRCPRCWRWVPVLQPSALGDVCPRCAEALITTP